MFKNSFLFISAALLLALANLYCANSAVIGLDLGSEFMKVSAISPGKAFYIVEDTTTKRKTPTSIGFYSHERIFEYDTLVKRPKAFQTTFTNVAKYLGKSFNDPLLKEQARLYLDDYMITENERGTVSFKLKNFKMGNDDETSYELTAEELLGMIFRQVKRLADKQAERRMKDTVATVPPYWGLKERYSLQAALQLADLNPISFIHENTGAALYYSLERQDNETHTVIFYNMGSTNVEVSLVEFCLQNSTEKYLEDERYESLRVIAETWDETLGGLNIDLNLLNHFAKEFDALPARKGEKSIMTSNPAKAKLLKEVNRLKEILSANKQAPFYIENLFESTDFKSSMDRTTFEEINAETFSKLTKPIDEVLAKSGKTLQDVDAIELIGGGIRVPKVQQILNEYMGGKELGFHLNGDEAMTMGAVFHGANFSASFKTRKILMSDGHNFDIGLQINELESGKSVVKDKEEMFFPSKTPYGARKTVSLDYTGDLNCSFYAKKSGRDYEDVVSFTVTGLKEGRENPKFEGKELGEPQVDLYFRLNPLGLVELTKAEATIEETVQYEEIKKKAKPVVVTTEETTEETTEATSEEATKDNDTTTEDVKSNQETTESASNEANETKEEATEETATESTPEQEEEVEKVIKTKKVTHRIPLKVEAKYPPFGPFTEEEITKSKVLLDKFDHHEEMKKKLAEAKNQLESFLYSTRDDLEQEGFATSATEEEKEELQKLLGEHREWLESEEASKADHAPFSQRYEDMVKIVSKIYYRYEQALARPALIEKARDTIKELVEKTGKLKEWKDWITEEAQEKAKEEIGAINEWLDEMISKQEPLKSHEDPVLTSHVIADKMTKAIEIFNRIKNTVKPKPPKNGTDDDSFYSFGKDGKFDQEAFKEYMKKMNITYGGKSEEGAETGEDGETINLDDLDLEQFAQGDDVTGKEEENESKETPKEEVKEEKIEEAPETKTETGREEVHEHKEKKKQTYDPEL